MKYLIIVHFLFLTVACVTPTHVTKEEAGSKLMSFALELKSETNTVVNKHTDVLTVLRLCDQITHEQLDYRISRVSYYSIQVESEIEDYVRHLELEYLDMMELDLHNALDYFERLYLGYLADHETLIDSTCVDDVPQLYRPFKEGEQVVKSYE